MMPLKYVKRYNKFNLQTNCRICLTQSATKVSLSAPLKGEQSPEPLISEALECIINEKLPLTNKYPNTICGMCAEFLKISYDLLMTYKSSKKKFREQLTELGEAPDSESEEVQVEKVDTQKAPVEIVVGKDKFNINELLIVEEEDDDSSSYDGFLRNLGKSISASIVAKDHQRSKPHIETPSLVIEKLPSSFVENLPIDEPQIIEVELDSFIQDSQVTGPIDDEDIDNFINEPVDCKVLDNMEVLNEQDRDLVQSALRLKYKCPHCCKPMASLTRVKIHSRRCDKNISNNTCYVCKKKFESRKQLLKHLKDTHLDEMKGNSRPDKKSLECHICGKTFRSNGSLFYHVNKHSGKKYGCDQCDKRFYTKTVALSHAQTHNKEKKVVVCPICGKGFHYKGGLFYHMKMHTNDRQLKCSFCPRMFYTRNSVKRHELTHTGDRPYDCEFCDKKFRSLGEVKKHKFLHTGERPFQCKYCQMGFTQAHNLKMHLMTHSGNFVCQHCMKSFADGDILKFHLKQRHQMDSSEIREEERVIYDNGEVVENQDQDIVESYYLAEEYEEEIDETNGVIVSTYELGDEVLVETVGSLE